MLQDTGAFLGHQNVFTALWRPCPRRYYTGSQRSQEHPSRNITNGQQNWAWPHYLLGQRIAVNIMGNFDIETETRSYCSGIRHSSSILG
jgi:hypothetical protein